MAGVKKPSKLEYLKLEERKNNYHSIFNDFTISPPIHTTMCVYQSGHRFRGVPGWHTTLAVYDHYIFHYILEGRGVYYAAGQEYEVQAGDIFLIHPNVPVEYQSDVAEPWTYYWIGFNEWGCGGAEDILQFLQSCGFSGSRLCLHFGRSAELDALFHQAAYPAKSGVAREFELLSSLYGIWSAMLNIQQPKFIPQTELYLKTAIEYIRNQYRNPELKVADVANFTGIERSYLYRIFTNNLHCSVQEYILSVRLKQACRLLTYSAEPVGVIAYSCGFESPAYFSSVFKDAYKMTPMEYRRNHVHPDDEKKS